MTYTLDYNTKNNQFLDSLPPCNLEIEEQVLGAVLLQPETLQLISFLPSEVFYVEAHQKIFRAFIELNKQGKNPDLMEVRAYLNDKGTLNRIGGVAKLAQIAERTVTAANIQDHANILIDKWLRRQAIELGQKITQSGYESPASTDQLLDSLEKQVLDLTQNPYRGNKKDPEYAKYQKLIEQIREIQTKSSPGFQLWLMQELGKQYSRSAQQLENIYFKELAATEVEPSMSIHELMEKYGDDCNEWLMHGLLPKGSTILLHALGYTGKSRLFYDLIYHLVTGKPWGHFQTTAKSRRCLIVQTDEPQSDMIRVLKQRGLDDENLPIRYKTKWLVEHIQDLRQEIEEHRPEFIFIDSLTSINRRSWYEENQTEYARPVLMLRDLAQEFGCTIVITHHSNGEGKSRGTKAIFNAVSEVWNLSKLENDKNPASKIRTLTIEKSRARSPEKYQISFDEENSSWKFEGLLDAEGYVEDLMTKAEEEIFNLLVKNKGTGYSLRELAQITGYSEGHIRRTAKPLVRRGLINHRKHATESYFIYIIDCEGTDDHGGDQGDHGGDHRGMITPDPPDNGSFSKGDQGDHLKTGGSDQAITSNFDDQDDHPPKDSSNNGGSRVIIENDHPHDHPPKNDHPDDHPPNENQSESIATKGAGNNNQEFKVGDRVELTSEAPFSGKGFITQVHPSDQYEICLEETSDLTVIKGSMIKLVKRNQVWGTQKDLPIPVIERLVIEYLQENGESEEHQIICYIGQKSPAVQTALKNVAAQTRQVHKGGCYETYWQLGGDGNG
jgi:replicative DNA helicase